MIYNFVPEVLWIGPLMVALILRPALAFVLAALAVKGFRTTPRSNAQLATGVGYGVLAILFFLGLFVQYAALIGIVFVIIVIALSKRSPLLIKEPALLYILIEAIFLCLLVTGAGPLALDSPL